MSTHALIATARFHGVVQQERFEAGGPVEIGGEPPLALPLVEGLGWLARVEWVGDGLARVTDPRGVQYALGVDEVIEIELGEVELELELAPQFSLRRTEVFPWRLSTGWLSVVLAFTIFTSWYDMVKSRRCELFAVTPELALALGCVRPDGGANGASGLTAEYLERLIAKDYAGDEDGVLERKEHADEGREANDFYMPAGNRGPTDVMGGAEDTAADSIRAPRSEALPEPEPTKAAEEAEPLVAPDDVGTEVATPDDAPSEDDDEGEDADTVDDEGEDAEQPAEEERGWGIQDWYDEKEQARDQREIDLASEVAKTRLKIDPNDPAALALLSYYQYLDEDYKAAESTYDRYIEILPDDAAGYNNKALVYKRLGQYAKEESLYRVALSLEPLDVTALNNLGVNLAHQGRHGEALEVMRQLEMLDPGDPYADLHRSKIHAEMGNDGEALRYLEEALKGMSKMDTLHHIEFRQDIRLDPSFAKLRETREFRDILYKYYGEDTPLQE